MLNFLLCSVQFNDRIIQYNTENVFLEYSFEHCKNRLGNVQEIHNVDK